MIKFKIIKSKNLITDKIEVFLKEKKSIKIPLRLFMKCHAIPIKNHLPESIKVIS